LTRVVEDLARAPLSEVVMQKVVRKLGFLAALGASTMFATACRDSGDDDGPSSDADDPSDGIDAGDDQPDGGDGELTIAEVRAGTFAVGRAANLKGVVVTAVSKSASPQGVYVQDPAGGEYSAIFVFQPSNIDDVAVGDVITVEGGVKDEFKCGPPLCNSEDPGSFAEIAPPDDGEIVLTKTGTGTVEPKVLDPATLAGAAGAAEAEKWESALIRFENVAVISPPNDFGEIRVEGPFVVDDAITALTLGGNPVALGDCFGSITGVVNYFFSYKLLPRSSSDMVAGEGCENSTQTATVAEVQSGAVPVGQVVKLEDVVVTAVLPGNNLRVWVADAGQAASGQGVLVFNPSGEEPSIGDVVDIAGTVAEFDPNPAGGGTLTQLTNSTLADTGTTATVTPVTVPVSTLAVEGTAEPYEGVLVKVENVKVTSVPDQAGRYTVEAGGATIGVDGYIFQHTPTGVGTCYTSITGIFDYFNQFKLEPRSAADLVSGACP
jgi:hypothetical protein